MTRTPYPGASWIDGWPDGRSVRLYPGFNERGDALPDPHLQTHLGRVDFPPGETWGFLFLKSAPPSVPFRVGGKLHDTGNRSLVREWTEALGWLGARSSPTGRCVYVGDVLTDYPDPPPDPNGYAWVSERTGRPVSYNSTYGPLMKISQWCEVADLLIGQAHDSLLPLDKTGLVLWDGTVHRMIEPGICSAYTVHRIGEAVTVNISKPGMAVRIDATLVDLRALPPVVKPPVPGPVPVPPVPPMPPQPPQPPVPPTPGPIPPGPVSPYRHHRRIIMADTLGVVRGPGGKLGRPDAKNTGPWANEPGGWRGIVFDGNNKADARYHFTRPAATPTALISKETGAVAGCDSTIHSGGLNKQLYLKPDGQTGQGWAETWQFYDGNANKAIMAVVEYAPGSGGDEGAFFAYPLAFEVL